MCQITTREKVKKKRIKQNTKVTITELEGVQTLDPGHKRESASRAPGVCTIYERDLETSHTTGHKNLASSCNLALSG